MKHANKSAFLKLQCVTFVNYLFFRCLLKVSPFNNRIA